MVCVFECVHTYSLLQKLLVGTCLGSLCNQCPLGTVDLSLSTTV